MERLSVDEIIEHCHRKTERFENIVRVENLKTAGLENNFVKEYWGYKQVGEYLAELLKYRQLEEQGLLLRLPCKVGDTVYILSGRFGTFYEEDICDGFYIGRDNVLQVKVQCHKGNHGTYGVIGETAFLTREEAEQVLKQMGG